MSSTGPRNRWLNTVTSLGIFIVVIGVLIAGAGLVAWLQGRGGAAPSTLEVTPIGLKLETSALALIVLGIGLSTSLLGFLLLITVGRHHKAPAPQVPIPVPTDSWPTSIEDLSLGERLDFDRMADQIDLYGRPDVNEALRHYLEDREERR